MTIYDIRYIILENVEDYVVLDEFVEQLYPSFSGESCLQNSSLGSFSSNNEIPLSQTPSDAVPYVNYEPCSGSQKPKKSNANGKNDESLEMTKKIYEEELKQTALLEKMYEEDVKKTELMQKFVSDSAELKDAFVAFLNK